MQACTPPRTGPASCRQPAHSTPRGGAAPPSVHGAGPLPDDCQVHRALRLPGQQPPQRQLLQPRRPGAAARLYRDGGRRVAGEPAGGAFSGGRRRARGVSAPGIAHPALPASAATASLLLYPINLFLVPYPLHSFCACPHHPPRTCFVSGAQVFNITFTQNTLNGFAAVWDASAPPASPHDPPGAGIQVGADANCASCPGGVFQLFTPVLGGTYVSGVAGGVAGCRAQWMGSVALERVSVEGTGMSTACVRRTATHTGHTRARTHNAHPHNHATPNQTSNPAGQLRPDREQHQPRRAAAPRVVCHPRVARREGPAREHGVRRPAHARPGRGIQPGAAVAARSCAPCCELDHSDAAEPGPLPGPGAARAQSTSWLLRTSRPQAFVKSHWPSHRASLPPQATIRITSAWYRVTVDRDNVWLSVFGVCGGARALCAWRRPSRRAWCCALHACGNAEAAGHVPRSQVGSVVDAGALMAQQS